MNVRSRILPFLAIVLLAASLTSAAGISTQPRLVVVITLDQFPYEYLTRFQKHLGPSGFKYLLDGAVFANASYKHANTSTGPVMPSF